MAIDLMFISYMRQNVKVNEQKQNMWLINMWSLLSVFCGETYTFTEKESCAN
jgi:hypothetical protein